MRKSEQWKLDRIDQSIGQLFDRVGCSIGLKIRSNIHSIGRLARSAGSFKWIVSSFDVKDVFVYDGLYYLSSWPIERAVRSVSPTDRLALHCFQICHSIGWHARAGDIPMFRKSLSVLKCSIS
ncbi:hypothetical protein HanRHA438_Chr07g0320151 [Helianthus annuus]|nr:hypothetical protein HanRHA438_Chr07g0320151 [Helianthus annuus]